MEGATVARSHTLKISRTFSLLFETLICFIQNLKVLNLSKVIPIQ